MLGFEQSVILILVFIVFICSLLIYSAIVTPYRIAFIDVDSTFYDYFDLFIDFCFFIDLITNFFTAYINRDENVIKNRKVKYINLI